MSVWKKFIVVLVLGLLALLIPGTIIKSVSPGLAAPNFLLILLVYLAFYEAAPIDALLAFLLGLELDLGSLSLLGPWAGSYVLVFGVLVLFSQRIFVESKLVVFVTVFVAALAVDFIYLVMLSLVYDVRQLNAASLMTSLMEGLFSAVFAPFLVPLLRRFFKREDYESPARTSVVRSRV